MDIIDNYLDTMFSTYPYTPKTVEAKRELRAMMEDVYNGAIAAGRSKNEAIGQALAEFGNLEEVAPLLGFDAGPLNLPQSGSSQTQGSSQPPLTGPGSNGQTPTPLSDLGTQQSVPVGSFATPPYSPVRAGGTLPSPAQDSPRPLITLAQAHNFSAVYQKTRWLLGIAVALFVVAPIPLVSLAVATGEPEGTVASTVAPAIGIAILLPLIALGVGLLIWRGQQLGPFALIMQGTGETSPEVNAYAAALRRDHAKEQSRALIIAISLWILSALPLVITGLLTQNMPQVEANGYLAWALGITLTLVAAGLLVLLPANWANFAAGRLSEEGLAEARQEKNYGSTDNLPAWARAFFAGYWPLIVGIYLAWSFVGHAWDQSWIIWPIAAVAFGAIAAVIGSVYKEPRA